MYVCTHVYILKIALKFGRKMYFYNHINQFNQLNDLIIIDMYLAILYVFFVFEDIIKNKKIYFI